MIIVVVDTMRKNAIRGVYRAPEGMELSAASFLADSVYSCFEEDQDTDCSEAMEAAGFVSECWLPCCI